MTPKIRAKPRKATARKAKPRGPSRAELARRVHDARTEIGAALFFLVPFKGGHPKRALDRTYLLNRQIQNLLHLAAGLRDGFEPEASCEGCSKPIGPGKKCVRLAEGYLCERCAGDDMERFADRMQTLREQNADTDKQIERAREFLRQRGIA